MNGKSDDGLMDYLNNFNKHAPEAITAAVDELRRRGKIFTDAELADIKTKIETRKATQDDEGLFPSRNWNKDIVTDPDAPLLYSKSAIRGFSILFSAIFGAVLLSTNINDKRNRWMVIGLGIAYTVATIFLLDAIPRNTSVVLLINLAGGLGLSTTFWDKFVGKGIKYRAKPIWIPLLISVIITIPFILAIIFF